MYCFCLLYRFAISSFVGIRLPHSCRCRSFFFFNDTAPTEIYTLSLHDALPIFGHLGAQSLEPLGVAEELHHLAQLLRSEEHTSELQSLRHLVCRLLLEKKKKKIERESNLTGNLRNEDRE